MYFLLTLFFASLIGIIFMIGRKLILLKNGQILIREENPLKNSYEEWKNLAIKNVKKHGYTGLVATIRFYIRGTNLLKNKYQEVKIKMKNRSKESINNDKKEISKFLKIISEYKHKIREIKHKIHKEEKGL